MALRRLCDRLRHATFGSGARSPADAATRDVRRRISERSARSDHRCGHVGAGGRWSTAVRRRYRGNRRATPFGAQPLDGAATRVPSLDSSHVRNPQRTAHGRTTPAAMASRSSHRERPNAGRDRSDGVVVVWGRTVDRMARQHRRVALRQLDCDPAGPRSRGHRLGPLVGYGPERGADTLSAGLARCMRRARPPLFDAAPPTTRPGSRHHRRRCLCPSIDRPERAAPDRGDSRSPPFAGSLQSMR